MFTNIQTFKGDNPDVVKYVFEKEDAVAEAVLYKYGTYQDRTVLCVSTQSGCPVGCSFCGTGKNFNRNLTTAEITEQVFTILSDIGIIKWHPQHQTLFKPIQPNKFQIMFMSMGEPMLNWPNVKSALFDLYDLGAELLISTVGVDNDDVFEDMIEVSRTLDSVGLQFSVHTTDECARNKLIPFKKKMNLRKLRDAGMLWSQATGRKVFLNFIVDQTIPLLTDDIAKLFSPIFFNLTFSVLCDTEMTETVKYQNMKKHERLTQLFIWEGYNVRIFNPAGQDDIGGGCGQLWYVQKWMKERKGVTYAKV